MTVWFVGAGPGDPDLMTVRARRLVEEASVCIWAGSLVNPAIVALLPATAEVHDSARLTLDETTALCAEATARGLDVVRLHTGDVSLYSAMAEQQRALEARAIPWGVVPGVSAFQAAAAALGVELTLPEVCQTVVLTRAPGRTPVPSGEELAVYARTGATICLYLSLAQAETVLAELAAVLGAGCPAAMVYRASWPDERRVTGTLGTLSELLAVDSVQRHGVLLVGRALRGEGAPSRLYAPEFGHGYRLARAEPEP